MATRTTTRKAPRQRKGTASSSSVLKQYKFEAKEIAAAREAMQRLHRGVEYEPDRLFYVTDLRLI
jgi:hypothetical protein